MRHFSKLKHAAIVAAILLLGYQNCSDVNFSHIIPSVGQFAIIDIPVTQENLAPTAKILLVIDDSGSMASSHTYLTNSLDSLIDPLQGKNIEVKVISTGIQGFTRKSERYVIRDGTPVYGEKLETDLSVPLSVGDIVGWEFYNSLNKGTLSIRATSNSQQFTSFKNSLKSKILSLGTKGSSDEMGLCNTIKALYQSDEYKFFKNGDKAAILILTDEDDSSTYDNCFLAHKEQAPIISLRQSLNYRMNMLQAVDVLNYSCKRDNNYVAMGTYGIQTAQAITNSMTCSSSDINRIKHLFDWYTRDDDCIITAHNCTKRYAPEPLSIHYNSLTDFPANYESLCNQSFTYNSKVYANAAALARDRNYHLPSADLNCTYISHHRAVGLPSTREKFIRKLHEQFPSEVGSQRDLKHILRNKMNSLFGANNYFLSNIILTDACQANPNQSVGTKYIALTNFLNSNNSNHSQIHSICSNDYSSALSQLSSFASSTITTTYNVDLAINQHILQVLLVRNGVARLLKGNEVSIDGSQINIHIALQAGDNLSVRVSEPEQIP